MTSPRMQGSATAEQLGISHRRLDYWTTGGYLKATGTGGGPGSRRTWSSEELAVAALMARLADAGLSVRAAHAVARAVHAGAREVELAPGITVAVEPAEESS